MTKDTDQLDNIGFIKHFNRYVLEEAMRAVTQGVPGDETDEEKSKNKKSETALPVTGEEQRRKKLRSRILQRHKRMWSDNPIIWVLEKMSAIEINIGKQRSETSTEKATPSAPDEKELAILREYLDRQ